MDPATLATLNAATLAQQFPPLGLSYLYNPLVPMTFPGGVAPFLGGPLVGIGGHPLMAFGLPPQAAGQQADEKASSCSPRKQDAMQAGDNGDQGEGETAHVAASAPFKRDSRKDQSAADLTEMHASSTTLGIPQSMSFTTAPFHALDALAAAQGGASLEFLQGLTTSVSAAMLQAGSPRQGARQDGGSGDLGHLPASALMEVSGMPRSRSTNTITAPIPHFGGILPIMPLSGAPTVLDTVGSGKPASKSGRQPMDIEQSKAGDSNLAEDAVSQLKVFLHQSQGAGGRAQQELKAEQPQSRKGSGSLTGAGRQQGSDDARPAFRGAHSSGGRRAAHSLTSARSASHLPHMAAPGGDGPPAGSRARGIAGSTGALNSLARISSLQALVEVAAAECEDQDTRGGGATASVVGTESADPDDIPEDRAVVPQDENEAKRLKRKQSNRESARRSRLKKQAEADALTRATSELQNENAGLRSALTAYQGFVTRLVQEKTELMAQLRRLGHELPVELDWTPTLIPIPAPLFKSP